MNDRPDDTLHDVLAAMRGDADRLGELLARYHGRLAAIVIATGAYRLVDDVVQEALIKILRAVRAAEIELGTVEQFRSWAHTVARNTALDHLRKEGRQMRHVDSVLCGTDGAASGGRLAGSDPTPSMLAGAQELLAEIRSQHERREEVVATLRRPDQMLVWMRERDDLTFPIIAERLGEILGTELTPDALRVRYNRLVADKLGPPVDGAGGTIEPWR